MIPVLPKQVVAEMSQRHHRFHHYLWHKLRNSWSQLAENERNAIRRIDPAWVPPRPALDATRRPIRDNDSGEDFLFRHVRMLAHVNAILSDVNSPDYPRVEGWRRVPPPDDPDYPVLDFPDSGLEETKSDEYFERFIAPWERQYNDNDYLRGVTLGQLGSDIEFTINNDIHLRWAGPSPVGYRPTTVVTLRIDREWDAPDYDYLGDTYSSCVNPVFWKLQGWVEDRIQDWKRAHGVTGAIQWRGTWLGPVEQEHDELLHETITAVRAERTRTALNKLQLIDQVISKSGANDFDGFYRPQPRVIHKLFPQKNEVNHARRA